jgi:hypothetical protein
MKIEIEWNCSYEATLRIEGRELKVEMRPGITSLVGLKKGESENTLGGMIASALYSKIGDAMQAEAIVYEETAEDPSPKLAWKRLPDAVADKVYDRID